METNSNEKIKAIIEISKDDLIKILAAGEHEPIFTLSDIRKAHIELKAFNRANTRQIDNLADFITRDRTVTYCDDEIYAVELEEANNHEQHD